MSILLAPKGTIEEMTSKIYRWWWASKEKGHGWAMLAWHMICLSIGMGDIGLRDLRLFNLALIVDKFDRLISYKDTLCFQVLSSKYFHNGDLFHLKKVDKPSFIWSSISAATRALEKGF